MIRSTWEWALPATLIFLIVLFLVLVWLSHAVGPDACGCAGCITP